MAAFGAATFRHQAADPIIELDQCLRNASLATPQRVTFGLGIGGNGDPGPQNETVKMTRDTGVRKMAPQISGSHCIALRRLAADVFQPACRIHWLLCRFYVAVERTAGAMGNAYRANNGGWDTFRHLFTMMSCQPPRKRGGSRHR